MTNYVPQFIKPVNDSGPARTAPIVTINDELGQRGLNPLSLTKWRKARAAVRAGVGRGRIVCLGDSTTAGVGATDATGRIVQAWPAVMARTMAGMGVASSTKSFMGSAAVSTANYPTYNPQVAINAGWAADSQEKVGGQGFLNTTNTNTIEFTPVGNIDSFELYALQNTGQGTIAWSIDAGGTTNIVLNNTPEAMYKSATLSAGVAGTHTIKVARVSGNAYLHGLVAWDATTPAVDVINAGRGSALTTTLTGNTRGWSPLANVTTLSPDLVILNIGINDYTPATLVAAATFETNLRLLLTTYTAFADVILVVPTPSDATRQTLIIQEAYSNIIRAVAAAYGVNLIDFVDRWQSYTASNALGYYAAADIVHPNATGYADMGEYIGSLLATV